MLKICNQIKFTNKFSYKYIFNQYLKQKRFTCDNHKKNDFPTKIDPNAESLSMKYIKNEMHKKLGLEPIYKNKKNRKSRDYLLKYTPEPKDLPPRTMNDSFTSVIIKLANESPLRDMYISGSERVRIGRLMEDMDLFAVWVCHKHVHILNLDENIHLPYTFVTVVVDKIKFSEHSMSIDNNIRLSGHVFWVGNSTMEVVIWVETVLPDGTLQKITRALFLMAARNATNTKAAPVNKLMPENEYEESLLLQRSIERKKEREQKKKESFVKMVPTPEEQIIMHNNFLKTLPKDIENLSDKNETPLDHCWMDESKLVDIQLVFPNNRNAHDTIFGGFLLRKAFENAIINASLYTNEHMPRIKYINDLSFHKPVEVFTTLIMTTFVTYTEDNFLQLVCLLHTRTVNEPPVLTNIFHYTFQASQKVPNIVPKSYLEHLWYLLGRKEFLKATNKDIS